jgi:hypothetical protein
MNPIEIKRTFDGSDAQMTNSARVTHGLLVEDLANFTAFDVTINPVFADAFLEAIDNADTVVADTAIIDMQVQKTEQILEAMDKAKTKYGDVKYFAQKTFPKSIATQNEFGLNDYDRARRSAVQMIQFLDEMHKACVKYQAQLLLSGFNATAIAEIMTIRTELQTANIDQEMFKKQRPKQTEDRVTVLNTCYEILVQINAAAQRVYMNDYAKRHQFVYKPSSKTSKTETFSGEVAPNTIAIAGTIPFDAATVFTFSNVGLVPLVFCLSKTTALEGIEISIGGGATITKTGAELNADATNMLVKNTSFTEIGLYEIEVDE